MTMLIDQDLCIACQTCITLCPTKALQADPQTRKPMLSRPQQCMSCSHCFAICPCGAISMLGRKSEDESFAEPKESVIGAIRQRRSVRRYLSYKLDKQFIRDLVNITKFCPSGMNFRPVKFIVLARSMIDKLAGYIAETCDPQYPGIQKLQSKYDVIFRQSQYVIVAYTATNAIWGQQDAAIAITTIDLFCQTKGVGSCWIGFLTKACQTNPKLMYKIGLDDYAVVHSCLGIGVPAVSFARSVARPSVPVEWRD